MGIVSGIVVFVMIWSVVLFTVLPWGVRRDDHPEPGSDPGAPQRPRIWLKFAITTAIAIVLWFVVDAVILSDFISFREP